MKVQVKKTVGTSVLEIECEGEKAIDALAAASQFTTIPEECSICQSRELMLDSNKAESFTFVKIKCLKCNARSNAGQFKDGSGIFWKPFEKYVPPNVQT